jgi:hypothetical protein
VGAPQASATAKATSGAIKRIRERDMALSFGCPDFNQKDPQLRVFFDDKP